MLGVPQPVSMVTSSQSYMEYWPCPLWCVCVCEAVVSVQGSQLCASGTVDMQLSRRSRIKET